MSYFWTPANKRIGVSADIDRHRLEEEKLEAEILELESLANPTSLHLRSLRIYREFLAQLLQSKAEAVNKLGRKYP